MQLVIDSNILFAALIRDSGTRKVFYHLKADFFLLPTNQQELQKYKIELIKKSHVNEMNFDIILEQLSKKCIQLEDKIILTHWKKADGIMGSIDPKDTPFIAAALATNSDIWSNDVHFKQQKKIKIWTTADLIKLIP